jgi:hypothetical protein
MMPGVFQFQEFCNNFSMSMFLELFWWSSYWHNPKPHRILLLTHNEEVVCLFVLFCIDEIHQTRMLQIVFLMSLESCQWGRGAWAWLMMFRLVMQKLLNLKWFFHGRLH